MIVHENVLQAVRDRALTMKVVEVTASISATATGYARLAGSFRVYTNRDAYPGGPSFSMAGFSMHDDEGGWIQRPSPAINHPDGTSAPRVIVMDGQGAYAGLTLVAAVSLANGRWDWHGYIIDGELPPAPTIELPE